MQEQNENGKKNNEKLGYGLPEELLVWDYISR